LHQIDSEHRLRRSSVSTADGRRARRESQSNHEGTETPHERIVTPAGKRRRRFDQLNSIKLPPTLKTEERTLSGRAFNILREGIISGDLAPGTKLDYTALAAELDMSPMPIREAIRQLEALGLVEHNPHRSARVTELSVEDLREVYTARFAIEARAVWEAALAFDEEHEQRATAALDHTVEAERTADHAASWVADAEFHFALYDAAHSPWLVRAITPLWGTSERYRRVYRSPERDFTDRHREHRAILDACVARDADLAARKLGEHLARSANRVAAALGGGELFAEDDLVELPVPRAR
jgi:DNA-binding GntR family transcriptional regulator